MGLASEGNVRAVSELIGAILLVGLVITAMAIVAVLVLSNPPPEEVPHLNALAGNTSNTILLYHTGGDELKEEQTLIRINNNPDPVPHSEIYLKSEDGTVESSPWATTKTQWGLGKTLVIPSIVPPQSITVTFHGKTSQHLILSTSFIAGGGITTPMTPGTTVTTTTTITTTATTTVPTTNATTPTPTSPTPTPTPGCGTISGYKWNDLNNNGAWDTGEPGLSGWTLNVSQCNQGNCNSLTYLFSSVTNASGYYIFSGLNYQPATWYRVQETQQSGWTPTSPSSGYLDLKLEPPGPGSVGIPPKCYDTGVNFGNRQVPTPTTPVPTPTPATGEDTLLNTNREGFVKGGGQVSFTIEQGSSSSNIEVGGVLYNFAVGDVVSLTVNGDSTNVEIDMNGNRISRFSFPDVTVRRNGTFTARGQVTSIWISQYSNMVSSLSILVPSSSPVWTRFVFDGNTLINGQNGQRIELFNLYPQASSGFMRLEVSSSKTYYDGAATSYQLT